MRYHICDNKLQRNEKSIGNMPMMYYYLNKIKKKKKKIELTIKTLHL